MKILYGVCGEGRGHASRSRILIHYLQENGHEESIVAGGKAYTILSEEFDNVLQIESPQAFNAACIERMGVDVSHQKFYEDDLKDFLDNLSTFQEHLQKYDPGNQEEILARIEQEIQHVTIQKKQCFTTLVSYNGTDQNMLSWICRYRFGAFVQNYLRQLYEGS